MENLVNQDKEKWVRPWNITKFDSIYDKDCRFFALVTKGLLSFMSKKLKMYDKPIKHYILSTGTEYLYVEANGYEYSWYHTSGEETLYSVVPRCVVDFGDVSIQRDELSAPFSRGYYERESEGMIKSYSAEIRRLPITINFTFHYTLSNFNESIILIEEILNKLIYQKYFSINYLGNQIPCSIEIPDSAKISYNKVDFGTTDKNKTIDFNIVLRTVYPLINERTEIEATKVIASSILNINPHTEDKFKKLDEDNTQKVIE